MPLIFIENYVILSINAIYFYFDHLQIVNYVTY
jgi:hypothetical protein